MTKVKPHLADLERTRQQKTRYGALRLDMNESVNGLPSGLVRDTLGRIDSGFLATYPEYDTLSLKIARHNRLYPENICISSGSDGAIKYIFDAFVSPKDKVLFAVPTFAMYSVYCKMFNASPVRIEYNADLTFPYNRYLRALSKGVRLAVIVNPNNPTGTMLSSEQVVRLVKKARDLGVIMIVDEAYFYYCPTTVIDQVKRFNNLIVLRTFSKLLGLAAGRIGYAAACPELIEGLRKVRPSYDVNALAVRIAESIIDNPSVIKRMISDAKNGKRYLLKALSGKGIRYIDGHANFIFILCKDKADDIRKALEREKVFVASGFNQHQLKGCIRVAIGDVKAMKRFFDIFDSIFSKACGQERACHEAR